MRNGLETVYEGSKLKGSTGNEKGGLIFVKDDANDLGQTTKHGLDRPLKKKIKLEENSDDYSIKIEPKRELSSTAQRKLDEIRRIRDRHQRNQSPPSSKSPKPKMEKDTADYNRYQTLKRERHSSRGSSSKSVTPKSEVKEEYDQESNTNLDREWYTGDEFGHMVVGDESNSFYNSYVDSGEDPLREKIRKRINARTLERQKLTAMWEENRMRTSGVVKGQVANLDIDDDEENRVHLFVHKLTPPFLDGREIFTMQKDPISAIRDPQSDLAVFSRKGSALVRERRQRRERQRQAREAASIAGTALGNVLGVKDETIQQEGRTIHRSNKFSDAIEPISIPQEKSLAAQRRSLPAFAVREELLKVIRDNQGEYDTVVFNSHFFFFFFFH
jgi:pre-mRNA-splicing factor ATP-dependent RNA helicase DHX38/PRP16